MIDGLTEAELGKLWLVGWAIEYNPVNGKTYIHHVLPDGSVQRGITSFPAFHNYRQAYNHLMSEISRWKREKTQKEN